MDGQQIEFLQIRLDQVSRKVMNYPQTRTARPVATPKLNS